MDAWVIVLIVVGAVILVGLLVGGRRARVRTLEERRVEAGDLRARSEEVAQRAEERQEAAWRQAEQARRRQEAAEREAARAQADRELADEQARRADEIDPDTDTDRDADR